MNSFDNFKLLTSQLSLEYLESIFSNTAEGCSIFHKLVNDVKGGILGDWIWSTDCQLWALRACKVNRIAISEFCSISALRSLIEDNCTVDFPYAKIDTLQIVPYSEVVDSDSIYFKLLETSLRLDDNLFLSKIRFKEIFKNIYFLTSFEKQLFIVELNAYENWPAMLQILSHHGKFFRPIKIDNKYLLLLPSFSLRNLLIKEIFGEEFACDPIPIIGPVSLPLLLEHAKKGGRIVSYNFPNMSDLIHADLIRTGKLLYSEHDWSHVEENSLISKSNRKLLAIFNELYLEDYYKKRNTGVVEHRIFSFGDMEFQSYEILWNSSEIPSNFRMFYDQRVKIFS